MFIKFSIVLFTLLVSSSSYSFSLAAPIPRFIIFMDLYSKISLIIIILSLMIIKLEGNNKKYIFPYILGGTTGIFTGFLFLTLLNEVFTVKNSSLPPFITIIIINFFVFINSIFILLKNDSALKFQSLYLLNPVLFFIIQKYLKDYDE